MSVIASKVITLTAEELGNLNITPVQLISQPNAGVVNVVFGASLSYVKGNLDPITFTDSGPLALQYGNAFGTINLMFGSFLLNNIISGNSGNNCWATSQLFPSIPFDSILTQQPIYLLNVGNQIGTANSNDYVNITSWYYSFGVT